MDTVPVKEDIQLAAKLCAQGLDGLAASFLSPFHSLENEFLTLGRELERVSAKANGVTREASELAEVTSGEVIQRAAAILRASLGQMSETCENSSFENDAAGLTHVAGVSATLFEIIRDFSRLVKHLSMLGIATRIESARIGGKGLGFSTLADDVEKLAGKIESSSEGILSMAGGLSGQCLEARKNITDMSQARKACSLSVLDLVNADLGALEELMVHSRSTAADISADATRMVGNVSEAVLSMQFHDIIRQQLEHVADALNEARTMAEDGPLSSGGHDASDWDELGSWIKDVLSLQESQLLNAGARFGEAVQTLRESLDGIRELVNSMADRARSLATSKGGQSALGQIEGEIRRIAVAMREYQNLEKRMSLVMHEVGTSIDAMTSSVAEIEEVGSEIELIALNAAVKAAHTGDEGKPLGVLASAIQKLSVDARNQTERIMELLGSIDKSSLGADARGSDFSGGGAFEEAVTALDQQVAVLKGLEEQASSQAARVGQLSSELSGEIESALALLDFKHDLLAGLASAGERVKSLLSGLDAALPPGKVYSQSPRLRQMLERYTMDAERLVHESVLGISGDASGLPGGDSDDNVELF